MSDALKIDQLFALDQQCFPDHWSKSQWQTYLLKSDRYPCFTLLNGDQLIGFALYQRLLDEVELLRIGVVPEQRGQGWASQLLSAHLTQFASEGVTRVMLEVRVSNEAAIHLYESTGFIREGVRKNYYPLIDQAGREDAVLMSRVV